MQKIEQVFHNKFILLYFLMVFCGQISFSQNAVRDSSYLMTDNLESVISFDFLESELDSLDEEFLSEIAKLIMTPELQKYIMIVRPYICKTEYQYEKSIFMKRAQNIIDFLVLEVGVSSCRFYIYYDGLSKDGSRCVGYSVGVSMVDSITLMHGN